MEPERQVEARDGGRRPVRSPLSRERILDAAVEFVDSNCLEDLSMRRLGASLGVEAMSLYRYVPSKASLLEGIAERLFAQLDLPDPHERDWQEQVRAYARSVRRLAHDHPRLFSLLVGLAPSQPAVRRVIERMVAMWRAAGFTQHAAFHAQRAVVGYVMGATLWEIQVQQRGDPADSFVEQESGCDLVRGHGDARSRARRGPPARADSAFEFGLEMLLIGLRARLEASPPEGREPGH